MSATSSVADVDAWITQLQDCKQLSESDIKKLCEKVKKKKKLILLNHEKWYTHVFIIEGA